MPSSSHIFRCIRPSGQLEPEDQRQPQSEEQTIPGEPLVSTLVLSPLLDYIFPTLATSPIPTLLVEGTARFTSDTDNSLPYSDANYH